MDLRKCCPVPACLILLVFRSGLLAADQPQPIPLIHVHAHNDYEHPHPLFDAMACGFCSFEGDINLVNGELLIAHSRSAVKPGRTLQSLYLDPMRKIIRENGGRLYRNGPPVWLLIDFKSKPDATWPVLREILQQYTDVLTTWEDGKMRQGAITAILTGDHPSEEAVNSDKIRYAAIDGTLEALVRNPPSSLVPWMSSRWGITFKWNGKGHMPESELQKLREIVAKAHKQGRLVRFWGAPDNLATWKELQAEDVDLINTDDLRGCADFLLAHPYPQK